MEKTKNNMLWEFPRGDWNILGLKSKKSKDQNR